jgi:hypothetical protein
MSCGVKTQLAFIFLYLLSNPYSQMLDINCTQCTVTRAVRCWTATAQCTVTRAATCWIATAQCTVSRAVRCRTAAAQ